MTDAIALDGSSAAPAGAAAQDKEETDSILVDGATALGCSTISSATLSIVVGTGSVNETEVVLVPYVDCDIAGTFGREEEEKGLSITLTLDNLAFLLEEFATEFAALLPVLGSVAGGPIKPLAERMDFTYQCIGRANASLAVALKRLREMEPGEA